MGGLERGAGGGQNDRRSRCRSQARGKQRLCGMSDDGGSPVQIESAEACVDPSRRLPSRGIEREAERQAAAGGGHVAGRLGEVMGAPASMS
ncbi:unnamed protein product [Urochloa humidicola]